ncbi:MAG TPA: ABC transporter substrate-binding protein [Actinobacteria bacterium]|jgi:ABC-type Fe3+-hydroxamate transport system substrate-binding protein|nr:ABC transporter substrate-binding protein [Actinomycetota bacterium]
MKNKKLNVLAILMIMVLVLAFVPMSMSCRQVAPAETEAAETTSVETSNLETVAADTTAAEETTAEKDPYAVNYPITIEDDRGQQEGSDNRQLVFDGPVTSVIAGENNFTLCLKEFGKLDAVKGIAYWVSDTVTELADSPAVITPGGFELERLIDLSPELLVCFDPIDPAIAEQLETAKIKIYGIGIVQSLDHIKKYIADYGMMFDSVEIATKLIAGMEEKQAKVKAAVDKLGKSEKPKAIYIMSVGSEYGDYVPGANTFVDTLIVEAGGINLPAEQGIEGWAEYSTEKLLESDPDVIIIPLSTATGGMSNFASVEDFTKLEIVQELKAVKEGKVFGITADYVNNLSFTEGDALVEFAEAINGIEIE